jgi:hypothetical protein
MFQTRESQMLPVRAYVHPGYDRRPATGIAPEPFRSAEQAWFWTSAALTARHSGATRPGGAVPRPCDPDDVIRCLDMLYWRKRIDLAHARVLRAWGERGVAPDGRVAAERREARLWQEALERLDWPLRVRGIVVTAIPQQPPRPGRCV